MMTANLLLMSTSDLIAWDWRVGKSMSIKGLADDTLRHLLRRRRQIRTELERRAARGNN